VEITVSTSGKFNGVDVTHLITYWTRPKPPNLIYGESQGVIMTKDGETATERGYGLGEFVSAGRMRVRGTAFFTGPVNGKISFLNNLLGVFEYEADEQGNTTGKVWEWK
jgi:hypothetical protein